MSDGQSVAGWMDTAFPVFKWVSQPLHSPLHSLTHSTPLTHTNSSIHCIVVDCDESRSQLSALSSSLSLTHSLTHSPLNSTPTLLLSFCRRSFVRSFVRSLVDEPNARTNERTNEHNPCSVFRVFFGLRVCLRISVSPYLRVSVSVRTSPSL